ncbi:exo-beta-D-glucosaminidase precursor [bacterium BMS3Abin03]|nr:exo-beta-D-glucosaminidase precursor [bacterium BMS3Abin03]
MKKKIELNNNWHFKIGDEITGYIQFKKWKKCVVPGTVHTDLLKLGLIEDPFYEDNELELRWISDSDWIYRNVFDYPDEFEKESPVILVFDGLDTIAEARLNNESIGKFDNMFRRYEIDITSRLKEKNNELEIKFGSPTKFAKSQEEKYGKMYVELNTERVYTRKAQYSFGWDWGPYFPTMGIWKPIYLLQKTNASITNLKFSTINISENKAMVEITNNIEGVEGSNFILDISLSLDDKVIIKKSVTKVSNESRVRIEINNPKLWWPCCSGSQPLYNLTVKLINENKQVIDVKTKKVGVRIVKLLLKENGNNTFKFLINNKEIFIRGANWIPPDSFLSRVTKDKYLKLLSLAKKANCNMIRVWGGGVYEQDFFYELCDWLGLLVWQDFMFTCGSYPDDSRFLENVKNEVIQNVERLQYHPSISLWCGNNECEWLWYQNIDKDIKKLPGYKIYHELIPDILNEIDPMLNYWSSSPFGNDEDPNDQSSGNTHQWNIWSNWVDYSEVKNDNSLFVSEFGFQAPANIETWEDALQKENLQCNNSLFAFHNKQVKGQERIFQFLSENLPISNEWNDFIYLTQLNQGLALKTCIEHWRSHSLRTNGAIIWQLNDCWPAVSWSIIDSDLKPKLSYYFVRDVFLPQIISFSNEDSCVKLNLNNHCKEETFYGFLKVHIIRQQTGEIIEEYEEKVSLNGHKNNVIYNVSTSKLDKYSNYVLLASLFNEKSELVYRNFYIKQKWKHIKLPKPTIDVKFESKPDTGYICLRSDLPSFFVDIHHPHLNFSDRGFILLPGEEKKIKIVNNSEVPVTTDKIKLFVLNNYLDS